MHERYESAAIAQVWSDQNRNATERVLWIGVMQAQKAAGLDIPQGVIDMYRDLAASQAVLDPNSEEAGGEAADIAALEAQTGHDLYARLRWFNEAIGADHAHRGLTSSDITENTQQIQITQSAEVLMEHAEQVLRRLFGTARDAASIPTVARTHGRPAQLTTIGKRATDWAVELMAAMLALQTALSDHVPRGIKGAVGTHADMARTLLPLQRGDASPDRRWSMSVVAALEMDAIIFPAMVDMPNAPMASTGQCYPRSTDLPIVSAASQVAAACGTIATSIRLMAALDLVVENPSEHVGSSAMPHKSNPRYSERVCSLQVVARGYAGMLQELAGSQWLEGDMSTSAARRIAMPGLFHTVDSMLANTAWILDHMRFDFDAIQAEVDLWMPEMASGALLATLVEAGLPRQRAHELLRVHYARIGRPDCESNRLLTLALNLEGDDACPLTLGQIQAVFDVDTLVGSAMATAEAVADDDLDERLAATDPNWPGDLV